MAREDGMGIGINEFDGTNFMFWRLQVEDYLYSKKLHQPLLGKKPENMTDDEWGLLDRQVLGIIRLTLTKNVVYNVIEAKTTEEIMSILSNIYEKPSGYTKVLLMKKLLDFKMKGGASVATHINEFEAIIAQLAYVKINLEDEIRALILLQSLSNIWEPVRTTIISSVGEMKLHYSDIKNQILAKEVYMTHLGEGTSSGSFLNSENKKDTDKNSNRRRNRSK